MSFLAPLFMLGALAIAAPVIFHLIRRTTREQTPFSSLMFLKQTPPRVTRRSRLENLWLLLLRCIAIALLALAFSRPFFQQHFETPATASAQRRTVILVDASASMRRGDLWKSALEKVAARLKASSPADDVALLTFSRGTQAIMSFQRWREAKPDERAPLALQGLAATKPGWAGTQLGAAILRAVELLDAGESAAAKAEIVVVSDMQEGADLDGLQGFAWPEDLRVVLDPVGTEAHGNASAHWLSESAGANEAGKTGIRLRVRSDGTAKREQFRLQWQPGSPDAGLDVYVPAGQARTASPPSPPKGAERLVLTGDDVDFDNTLNILPPAPTQVPVLFVGNDKADDEQGALFYLRRAFPPTREQIVEVVARPTDTAPAAFELQRAQLLILGDGITGESIAAAREFASSGKIAVLPLARPESGAALAELLGIAGAPLSEARGRDYAMLAHIDFTHPLFAPFADPRFSDFTKIHFWKHRMIDATKLPGATVIAKFDDDTPAITQAPIGSGSALILGTTWRPADSQLALSSKFVPLLHAMLDLSSKLPPRRAQYFVGDPIPLPPSSQPFTVKKPDGTEIATPAETEFTATDEPGVYTASPGPLRFVVNLAPAESRLDPLDRAKLAALGVPLEKTTNAPGAKTAADPGIAKATELESRQKLWRWLIATAVAVLLIETLIAARLSRSTPSHANA